MLQVLNDFRDGLDVVPFGLAVSAPSLPIELAQQLARWTYPVHFEELRFRRRCRAMDDKFDRLPVPKIDRLVKRIHGPR